MKSTGTFTSLLQIRGCKRMAKILGNLCILLLSIFFVKFRVLLITYMNVSPFYRSILFQLVNSYRFQMIIITFSSYVYIVSSFYLCLSFLLDLVHFLEFLFCISLNLSYFVSCRLNIIIIIIIQLFHRVYSRDFNQCKRAKPST